MNKRPVLSVQNVTKRFGGLVAVDRTVFGLWGRSAIDRVVRAMPWNAAAAAADDAGGCAAVAIDNACAAVDVDAAVEEPAAAARS